MSAREQGEGATSREGYSPLRKPGSAVTEAGALETEGKPKRKPSRARRQLLSTPLGYNPYNSNQDRSKQAEAELRAMAPAPANPAQNDDDRAGSAGGQASGDGESDADDGDGGDDGDRNQEEEKQEEEEDGEDRSEKEDEGEEGPEGGEEEGQQVDEDVVPGSEAEENQVTPGVTPLDLVLSWQGLVLLAAIADIVLIIVIVGALNRVACRDMREELVAELDERDSRLRSVQDASDRRDDAHVIRMGRTMGTLDRLRQLQGQEIRNLRAQLEGIQRRVQRPAIRVPSQ